jgi:glycosyltransferase involved in cell wall biosynthesis
MSCECACVVTDVGDSAMIVDDCGIVVKSNDIDSLYNGLENMIKSDYQSLGKQSRQKIIENFSIKNMIQNTEKEILKCVE